MSQAKNCTLTCPCGTVFDSPIYEYVNIATEPRLQYTILAGLLNVSTCPACGRRVARARPFVYSDLSRKLLAYVHPRADAPEEARTLILEKLRGVYAEIEIENDASVAGDSTSVDGAAVSPRELPPLQVVFGLDQLNALINATLTPHERLGRLALSTRSRDTAERGQLFVLARKLAREMECQAEVEELPDEYTVWLYGSRRQIGAIMRELALPRV